MVSSLLSVYISSVCLPLSLSLTFSRSLSYHLFSCPLQEVILRVWSMSEGTSDTDGILRTLEDLPESPDLENVDKSLSYLHTSE